MVAFTVCGCRESTAVPKQANENAVTSIPKAEISTPETESQPEHVQRVLARIQELGTSARSAMRDGKLTEIVIQDGSDLTAEDISLIGQQTDLVKLQILNCRSLNDSMAGTLSGLQNLTSLALTNTVISDTTVEMIVQSFPKLVELDLSSNTNMTRGAMKHIAALTGLRSLTLIQNRFNDVSARRLRDLQELRSLDLRGNMEASDMAMEVVGELPRLTSFKHRSTAVSDEGVRTLADGAGTLENLLIQDFKITSASGAHLAKLKHLKQLEIFRCQGFGSDGVVALSGLGLERLTLRDLPSVDDAAMEVFSELPALKRLYLHELDGVTDAGLSKLAALSSLELLDVWSLPQMTDASLEVLAGLPNLKELSLRETGITDSAIDKLLTFPNLQSLTIKENGNVSNEALKPLSNKKWFKLDLGAK